MARILAIDTSNYTTSISIVDGKNVISDKRQLLSVESGKRGLQQSEAVFKHITNLPILMEEIIQESGKLEIDGIGVSTRPRPVEGSYMPVFKAGESFARFLSSSIQKPLFKFSHQEGHIEAGLFSCYESFKRPFLALHLSGGTTEILKVSENPKGYNIEIIGGTSDISAGQLIDRIGVAMGYGFPSGKYIDELALKGDSKKAFLPPSTSKLTMSFSGAETAAKKMIASGVDKEDIASSVLENISRSIFKTLLRCISEYDIYDILFAGGVSSSIYLRKSIYKKFKNHNGINIGFANPKYCTDNSVGIAILCNKMIKKMGDVYGY